MKANLKYAVLLGLFLLGGVGTAYPQLCGGWTVTIELVDTEERPIPSAKIVFVDVPEDDAANGREFKTSDQDSNFYVASFTEGEKVANVDRDHHDYKILIVAKGFYGLSTTTKVAYCRNSSERKVLERRKMSRATGPLNFWSGDFLSSR